ncbi:ISPsy9 [Pseudomonas syringae pv. maculicola str. M6]|nr:ISPsy9 [Pseudomonas syringae pv. maculicola str. M6]
MNSSPINDESRSRDELLAEVKQLRMEVDYLKKLDALVQKKQRIAQQKKRKS